MKRPLSGENPHGPTRYGYAWQVVVDCGSRSHLDIGCHEGAWLASLASRGPGLLCGVDVDGDAVAAGKLRFPGLRLEQVSDSRRLPFEDSSFDSATLLDVLEHLDSDYQREVLREVRRVLRPGGHFIVTVPGRHLLSFLDLGNLKFVFPTLHGAYYSLLYGREKYLYRYRTNPYGLIGDVAASKAWHEHFGPDELRRLLDEAGFGPIEFDGAGFFHRALVITGRVAGLGSLRGLWERLISADARRFSSANIFAHALAKGTP